MLNIAFIVESCPSHYLSLQRLGFQFSFVNCLGRCNKHKELNPTRWLIYGPSILTLIYLTAPCRWVEIEVETLSQVLLINI